MYHHTEIESPIASSGAKQLDTHPSRSVLKIQLSSSFYLSTMQGLWTISFFLSQAQYASVNGLLTFCKNNVFGKSQANQNAGLFKLKNLINKLRYEVELLDVIKIHESNKYQLFVLSRCYQTSLDMHKVMVNSQSALSQE